MTTAIDGLRHRVVRGMAWSTSAAVMLQFSRFAFGIVLARLLTPREWGIAGMALVFSALVVSIADFGLGAGLVQRATITEEDRSTVFWTSMAVGVALAAGGIGLSGTVASFFGEPAVRPLFAAVAAGFLLTAVVRVHAAILQREMAYRAIALRVMAATIAGGLVAIPVAALGYGAWALVAQHLTNGLVTAVLLWALVPWRPRLVFSRRSLRDLGGFGLNVLGSKLIDYINLSADKILVGRVLGSSTLGVYNIAYGLVLVPLIGLMVAVMDTLFPAFSRVQQSPARVASAWLRASRSVVAVVAPCALGLVLVAPEFVGVVLGERWSASVPIVQVLALAAVVHAATALGAVVLISIDRTATVLRFSIGEVVVVLTAIGVGLHWGAVGVAAGYALATLVARFVLVALTARALSVSLRWFLGGLGGVVQAAAAMALVVAGVRIGLLQADVAASLRLPVLILIGAAVYVPLCLWRVPELIAELRGIRADGAAAARVA